MVVTTGTSFVRERGRVLISRAAETCVLVSSEKLGIAALTCPDARGNLAQWWCGSASVKCLMAHSAVTDAMMPTAANTNATRSCLLIVKTSLFFTCYWEMGPLQAGAPRAGAGLGEVLEST
jgi:hypothetical protein